MSTNRLRKCITHKASIVDTWIGETQRWYNKSVVGLDTEWYREAKVTKIAILQLCVEDRCLIYQMWRKDTMPSSLFSFLMDPNFTFVAAGIDGDMGMLRKEYNLNCARYKDLGRLAMKKWPGRWSQTPSLKSIALLVAGINVEKDKNITMSKWNRYRLSDKQVEYAALDAYASYQAGVGLEEFFDAPESSSSAKSAYKFDAPESSSSAKSAYKSPYDDDYYSSDDDSYSSDDDSDN